MEPETPVARFLAERYPPGSSFVEIGVGSRTETAEELREMGFEVVTTDVEEGVGDVADDIFAPDRDIYREADALYSVRPGEEMQVAAAGLAEGLGLDLVVRPLGTEIAAGRGFELHNVEGRPVYLLEG